MKVRYVSKIIVEMEDYEAEILHRFIANGLVGSFMEPEDLEVITTLKDCLEKETEREA